MTDQPRDYLTEGGISLAFVVLIQLAYCTLEWRALATQPERRHRLLFTIFCASIFNSLSLGFLIAGSMSSMDEAKGLSCMGMTELSIWSTEFIEVLLPLRTLTQWSKSLMRIGCLASFAFVCLGLWLMIDRRLELVWGSPGITHINVTVLVCTGQRSRRSVARGNIDRPNEVKSKLRRLQYGVALTASASALCVVFCILAVIRLPPTGQQPSQCAFASVFLFPKAYLRLKRSREASRHAPRETAAPARSSRSSFANSTTPLAIVKDHGTPSRSMQPSPRPTQPCSSPLRSCDSAVSLTASNASFLSSTTAGSIAHRRYTIGNMEYAEQFSIFRVDKTMLEGFATIHYFYRSIDGNASFPATLGRPAKVLQVGAATTHWASDVRSAYPRADIACTNIVSIPSIVDSPARHYIEDANTRQLTWSKHFNWIHARDIDGGISDWGVTLKAVYDALKPGGFASLEQLIFDVPPDDLEPYSIWHAWKQALGYLKDYKGLSFQLHDTHRIEEQLKMCGYEICSNKTYSYHIKPGQYVYNDQDLLQAITNLMQGVLWRAWTLRPSEQQDLDAHLQKRFREEIGKGLEIKVVKIIARRPTDPLAAQCVKSFRQLGSRDN